MRAPTQRKQTMKRYNTFLGILIFALPWTAVACSSSTVPTNQNAEQITTSEQTSLSKTETVSSPATPKSTAEPTASKISAPVEVSVTTNTKGSNTEAVLMVKALSDVPRGVGRIVIPNGIRVVKGPTEIDFGALKQGQTRELRVELQIPNSRGFDLTGGVDVHLAKGVKLHKNATRHVGIAAQPSQPNSRIVKLPSGESVRVSR
jgi:hypothetical protein